MKLGERKEAGREDPLTDSEAQDSQASCREARGLQRAQLQAGPALAGREGRWSTQLSAVPARTSQVNRPVQNQASAGTQLPCLIESKIKIVTWIII